MNAEPEGFAQFIEARERSLLRTAWLLTGDWALAEDLVQTALARSWPRWEGIRRRDNPEIYVRRVMINTWTTWQRRRWRGEQASADVPEGAAPGDMAAEVAGHSGPVTSVSPVPTRSPSPVPSPTGVRSPRPSPSPTGVRSPTPTPSPSPTGRRSPTPTPRPSPSPAGVRSPQPSPSPTGRWSPRPGPTAT